MPPVFNKTEVLRRSFQYFNGVENRFGFSWKRYSIASAPSEAGGATPVFINLRNSTGIVAVVEKILISTTVADAILLYLGNQGADPVGVPVVAQRLDSRIGSTPSGLSVITNVNGGGASFPGNASQLPFGRFLVQNGVAQEVIVNIDQQFVIGPGDGLYISQLVATAATQTSYFIMWRERLLEEIEKSGNYGRML